MAILLTQGRHLVVGLTLSISFIEIFLLFVFIDKN